MTGCQGCKDKVPKFRMYSAPALSNKSSCLKIYRAKKIFLTCKCELNTCLIKVYLSLFIEFTAGKCKSNCFDKL